MVVFFDCLQGISTKLRGEIKRKPHLFRQGLRDLLGVPKLHRFAMQRYKIKIKKKPHPSCDARAGQCVSLYVRNKRIWCCKQDSDVGVKGENLFQRFAIQR